MAANITEKMVGNMTEKIDAFLKKHRKFSHIVVEIYVDRISSSLDVVFYFKDNPTGRNSCYEFRGRTGKYMREFVDSLYD